MPMSGLRFATRGLARLDLVLVAVSVGIGANAVKSVSL
jgi:hypothetical protein